MVEDETVRYVRLVRIAIGILLAVVTAWFALLGVLTVLSDSAFDDAGDSGVAIAIFNLLAAGVAGSIAWVLLRPRRDSAAAGVHAYAKRETES